MVKLLKALPIFLFALVLIILIIANRHVVEVSLWPTPIVMAMPLYLIFFLGLFFGVFIAWIILLVRSVRHAGDKHMDKREMARMRSRITDLELELDRKEAEEAPANQKRIVAKTSAAD